MEELVNFRPEALYLKTNKYCNVKHSTVIISHLLGNSLKPWPVVTNPICFQGPPETEGMAFKTA